MPTSVLQSDDFRPRIWIITESTRTRTSRTMMGDQVETEDYSYTGVPMKVLAINRPFILVEIHYLNGIERKILNMKEFVFTKLTPAFVQKVKQSQRSICNMASTDAFGGIFEPIKKARRKL